MGLEEHLDIIRDLVADEGSAILTERSAILADIWTALWCNRKAIADLRTRADTLQVAVAYHRLAHRYVSGAHHELLVMEAAMEDLRSFAVESLFNEGQLPMRAFIESTELASFQYWCLILASNSLSTPSHSMCTVPFNALRSARGRALYQIADLQRVLFYLPVPSVFLLEDLCEADSVSSADDRTEDSRGSHLRTRF
ncbi:hypothetical protein DENSPDRAFT_886105 [Dentipellis sp. KUC8613]|nr:hypothetical protein DENSPDRAFT_886105 [Dentipellis sp. KUC8613]